MTSILMLVNLSLCNESWKKQTLFLWMELPRILQVKSSLGERQQLNDQVTDVVTESSGARDQPNPANSEQHEQQSSKEPSDITEQYEQMKTETDVQKGVDASKSDASVPDDIQPACDEQEIKVGCK
ncbi:hypothetical protein Zm00014a_019996 [Zea mays]|uniref:Uncharacterized protein n=2 Tax=Zea mays TaxID=4577 RepID=A0A8J8XBY5_MAIZE|nr:AT hook motif family protein [Zea mays]PWZ43594.1 hypothetical protein Zm00014a_019996 [Zea mays]